jgi:hypothetical protein
MKNITIKLSLSEKILSLLLLFIIYYFSMINFQIHKDYLNSLNGKEICRFANVINGDGYLIFGNAKLPNNFNHYLGNHIWIESKLERKRIDNTCFDCPIIEKLGELEISNGYVKPDFSSFNNSIASLYYVNFSFQKYFKIIK